MGLSLDRRRRSKEREIQIPMDVVTEVLTRLPAKSLMRFKCVSKLWASLIRSQYFSNRFLMVPSQRLYMSLLDINDDDRNSVILSSAPHATTPSSFVVNHDLTIPCVDSFILQNLRGFMCYSYSIMPRIYNPTTRQLVNLPAINLEEDRFYFFGHDPVNDQYKVICLKISISEQWVLVLKPGASWKKATPVSVNFCPHIPVFKPGLSINGVIYYLGLTESYNDVVVSFDIGSEEFKTIQAPRLGKGIVNASLIEYGGKVAVFDHTHLREEGTVDLWVVEDAGNKEWLKKTLVLQPSQLYLVNNISFKVKGTTQSGKVLLIRRDLVSPFHILCYDLESNDMRKIDIEGMPDRLFSKKTNVWFDLMFMDQSENITYLET